MGAEDKGTGKREKITITNDKGRLSQDEIERMVSEAEEFAESDKAVKAKIDARNKFEGFAYNVKSQLDDKLGKKLEKKDKDKAAAAVKDALEWLEENADADADELEEKLKSLEDVVQPIIAYVYKGGAPDEEDLDSHDEL